VKLSIQCAWCGVERNSHQTGEGTEEIPINPNGPQERPGSSGHDPTKVHRVRRLAREFQAELATELSTISE